MVAPIRVLAAVGRTQLQEALRLAGGQPFVVFATLDGWAMGMANEAYGAGKPVEVYLYETG